MIHAQRQILVRDIFTVHKKKRKITDVIMLKFVRFADQRTDEICILNHGEKEMFRNGAQNGVVD